jgi:hypothetical protein
MTTRQKAKGKCQKSKVRSGDQFLPFALCLLPFAFLLVVAGCKNPFDSTRNASGGGPTGTFSGSSTFVIFYNELVSGGGAFLYPGSDGQSLSFNDTSNPIGYRSIRYSWTGQPVSNPGCSPDPTHNFAGFDLMHTPTLDTYLTTPGRDLSKAGYTKVTFYARGSLSSRTLVKVEVASAQNPSVCVPLHAACISLSVSGTDDDDNNPCGVTGTLTSSWQHYSIPVDGSTLTAVKNFFKSTFIFNDLYPGSTTPGQGGTVYFDQILYQQ